MLGIVFATALLAQASALPAWTNERYADGWEYLGAAGDLGSFMMTKPGPRPSMIWVRVERELMQEGALSYMMLIEADCSAGRYRRVQAIQYAKANLNGQSETFDGTTPWSYPGPGTLSESFYRRGCAIEQ